MIEEECFSANEENQSISLPAWITHYPSEENINNNSRTRPCLKVNNSSCHHFMDIKGILMHLDQRKTRIN